MRKRISNFLIKISIVACAAACGIIVLGGTVSAKDKDTVTVVIDPGHGGPATVESNLGACYNGLVESEVNLNTALLLKSELEQYGNVKVYLTRNDNSEVSLENRVKYAKSVGADFIVAVHYNASADHLFYGSEIFVPSGQQYAYAYSLASYIMKQWTKGGAVDKGIKTRIGQKGDYYGLIRHGASYGVPAIILEHGYLDNKHDLSSVNDKSDWTKIAKQDAAGIAEFYGLKKGRKVASCYPQVWAQNPVNFVADDTTGPALAMTVNSYNKQTGEVRFTLTAKEPESRVYLYGMATATTMDSDGNIVPACSDLVLWGNKTSVTGSFKVTPGYTGPLYAVCYNNYNFVSNLATALVGY